MDWGEVGVCDLLWREFIQTLNEQQTLDWEEYFIDGSFDTATKEGIASERRNAGSARCG